MPGKKRKNGTKGDASKRRIEIPNKCGVCAEKSARYKCSQKACLLKYCSLECYKVHAGAHSGRDGGVAGENKPVTKSMTRGVEDLLYPVEHVQPMYTMLNNAMEETVVKRADLEKVARDATIRRLVESRPSGQSDLRQLLTSIDAFQSQRIRERLVLDILQGLDAEQHDAEGQGSSRANWTRNIAQYNEWQLLGRDSGKIFGPHLLAELATLVEQILTTVREVD